MTTSKDDVVQFITPYGNCTRTDFLPFHLFGKSVIYVSDLFVVKVARVAYKHRHCAALAVVSYLRRIAVLGLVRLVNETLVAFVNVFLVFIFKTAGVDRQRMRIFASVKTMNTF